MTVTVSSAPAGTITVQPGDRTPASVVIKTFNIENATTSEIQEGVNLYFSNARAVAALTAGQSITIDANGRINSSATSSSNYTDSNTYANVNLIGYATTTNVALKANIVDLTTANVAELTNLYYTNARVYSNVITLGYITSSALSGYATNTQLASYATNAQLSSYATNAQLASYATNAQLSSYATTTNVALKANIVDLTTTNVTELTNLYYTNARTYSNVISIGYATNANVALKANIIDLTTAAYGFRTSNANAIIYTSAGDWVFTANGTVILPNGATIKDTSLASVAFGQSAGSVSQGEFAVAIGDNAGNNAQGTDAVAIGASAGLNTQGSGAVAFGQGAGETSQGNGAVAIGKAAGGNNQGINSIAIGKNAGQADQGNNSIILNATGAVLDQTTANTFIVAPIRNATGNNGILQYNDSTKEITYSNTITLSNITVSGNITGNTNGFAIGYLEAPQNTQNTSYTLTLTDSGKHIYSQNTATQVLTIPTNANVAFAIGTAISIVLQGSGSMIVSPFSGVTLYLAGNSTSASRTISTYGMATLMKVATDTWFINGTGVS